VKRLAVVLAALLAAFAAVAIATPAAAESPQERAKALFNAGVEAYKEAEFLDAAQAFMKAYELVPKPDIVFSIGQAFRRQFTIDPKPEYAKMAYKHFRQYVDEVKQGGKVVEAARALSELAPYAGEAGSAVMQFPTRLRVDSNVDAAVVSIDGGPPRKVPFRGEIKPGPHRLRVEASGYFPEERSVDAVQGELTPADVPLRGRPPLLDIEGADGADVAIDGRTIGTAPFARPFEMTPGRHFVAVSQLGHKPYASELDFQHGATTVVDVELPATNQRRAAYGVVVVSVASLVTAGILVGVAYAAEEDAKSIEEEQAAGSITEEQRIDHNDAIELRDDLRIAAAVTAGAGAAVGIAGIFLLLLDEPTVVPPAGPTDDRGPAAPGGDGTPEPAPGEVEIVGAPAGHGLGLRVRF
jgi:PEGA domain-containing protein